MKAEEFIRTLDNWTAAGGPFPRIGKHDLTTVAEAEALCRAVASAHIYTPGELDKLALFDLMSCFQASDSREVTYHLRDHGLPILRRILRSALQGGGGPDRVEMRERRKAHLFVVKVLCAYQQRGDAALIVQAARDPDLAEGYLWDTIFGMIAERHPEAAEICDPAGRSPAERWDRHVLSQFCQRAGARRRH